MKLSGVSLHQLRHWDRINLLSASYSQADRRQAYSRVYSFRDLVSLRVLNLLRNNHKVSLQHLRNVAGKLAHLGDEKWTKTTLYVLGRRVVIDDPKTLERHEVVSGQRVLDIPLKAAISDTLDAIKRENSRSKEEQGKIIKKRFLLNSQPVFQGSRVPVSAVNNYIKRGYSDDDIIMEFPDLTVADITEARKLRSADAA